MELQERFDMIVDNIETLMVNYKKHEILPNISKIMGLNSRFLNDSFSFITNMTLRKYITQRCLVHALQYRLEHNLPIEEIVQIAGFSDAAAFSRACKDEFGLSPSKITKELLQKYTPLYFCRILNGDDMAKSEDCLMCSSQRKGSLCGVPAKKIAEIKTILEIASIYELTDEEAEFVHHLSQHLKISIWQAAEFYEDYKLQLENDSYQGRQEIVDIAELSIKYNQSFSEAQAILYEVGCHGYNSLQALPEGFFDIYFSEYNEKVAGYDVPYICEILSTIEDNGMSVSQIPEILENASLVGGDIIELIENYEEYIDEYDKAIDPIRSNSTPIDDTDGFGYRSIWELDETDGTIL